MATIEDMAYIYAERTASACGMRHTEDLLFNAFLSGADYMREELTRWRDPKEELPEEFEWVLLKIKMLSARYGYVYATGRHAINGWQVFGNYSLDESSTLIGWRPIEKMVE